MNKNGRGFLTFAENTEDCDYLRLAYLQALNIKCLHPKEQYAVIINKETEKAITTKHKEVFDHIIVVQNDYNNLNSKWRLANESQVFDLTPFKETMKIESDLLFTQNINHWWNSLRLRDVVLSSGCMTYKQQIAKSRHYREFFDVNQLPDVYNGMMYFRFSQTAYNFFELAKQLQKNWSNISVKLKKCYEIEPSTDTLYALTSRIIGEELTTIPTLDFFKFVHMKSEINEICSTMPWYESLVVEFDDMMIRLNNINQYYPIHYQDKSFVNDEIINYYESKYKRIFKSI